AGRESIREDDRLRFEDPEGLEFELLASPSADEPLVAWHSEIPERFALRGFAGVRAFTGLAESSSTFLTSTVGFRTDDGVEFEARGETRGAFYGYDEAPERRGLGGSGTVHHIAWSSTMEDHAAWRERVVQGGADSTPIIDRFYFRSIYFREPSGVLFEIATVGPGFSADEPKEHLGD